MAELTLTVQVPDGMTDSELADVKAWLSSKAEQVRPDQLLLEEDVAWREATLDAVQQGMADVDAGRTRSLADATHRLVDRHKLTPPQ